MADGDIQLEPVFPLGVHDDYPISIFLMATLFPVTICVVIISTIAFSNWNLEHDPGPVEYNVNNWAGWGFIL